MAQKPRFEQLNIGSYVGGADGFQLFDDFIGSTTPMLLGWAQGVLGAGAAVAVNTSLVGPSAPGVISLSTGTTTTGRAVQFLGTRAVALPGVPGNLECEWRVQLPVLPTVADQFFANIGMQDTPNTSTEGVDAVSFRLPASTVGPNWIAYVRKAGVETLANTGVPVAINAWTKLRMQTTTTGNLQFLINNVVVATIAAAALPVAAMAPAIKVVKTAGANARTLFADYALVHAQLAASR
jgi:hypothetical protein